MSNIIRPSAPESGRNKAKEAKDFVNQLNKKEVKKVRLKVECGINNPCNFGVHNPNFNKNNINL